MSRITTSRAWVPQMTMGDIVSGRSVRRFLVDLGQVQALDQRMGRARPGPDLADPSRSDDADVDLPAHLGVSMSWWSRPDGVLGDVTDDPPDVGGSTGQPGAPAPPRWGRIYTP